MDNIAECKSVYRFSSIELERRKIKHFYDLRKDNHHCAGLQNAFNKYGDRLKFIVIELCDKTNLRIREQWWLDNVAMMGVVLYNSSKKAISTEQTLEIRTKISVSKKGILKSIETRQRMSDAKKGIVFSDEHRKALSLAKVGKVSAKKGKSYGPMSVEIRKKMSEKQTKIWADRKARKIHGTD